MRDSNPSPDRRWGIYALKDPLSGEIRYVGWSFNPERRLNQHLSAARKGVQTHNAAWLRKLLSLGRKPDVQILESGDGSPFQAEISWIARMKHQGCRLTNLTNGGDGLFGASASTRAKISRLKSGVKHSEAARARMSEGCRSSERARAWLGTLHFQNRGRKKTALQRARSSEAIRNSPRAQAHIAALSVSNRGRACSRETRDKIRKALTGRTLSLEHRIRLSIANGRRTSTAESRVKTSLAMKGIGNREGQLASFS